jgi:hypothetical protein
VPASVDYGDPVDFETGPRDSPDESEPPERAAPG